MVVGLQLVILFPHARHPQRPFMDQILQDDDVLLKLFQLRVLFDFFQGRKLFNLKFIEFGPEFFYFLREHSCVLIEVFF